jgi:hypothetical protein
MPIYKGTLKTGAAYKGNVSLSRIYKGAYLVFEAFKTLIAEGVPPLTLLNCVTEIMLGYRVYGNSVQGVPSGYIMLDYIQSTGTQYINTGIVPTNNFKMELDAYSNTTGSFYLAGARSSVDDTIIFAQSGTQNGSKVALSVNGTSAVASTDGVDWTRSASGQRYKIMGKTNNDGTFDYRIEDLTYNRTFTATNIAYTPITDTNTSILLFAINGRNIIQNTNRIYNVKLYDSNELVFNGIPCYRKSDEVIGIYDTVSGTFFQNAGTGAFTAGTKKIPTPTNPIEIESVGDRTKNLLQNTATNQTINGVTFTVNSDGSVTCNGTATANTIFRIVQTPDFPDNEDMLFTGCPVGGSLSTYQLQYSNNRNKAFQDIGNGIVLQKMDYNTYPNTYVQIRIVEGYTCNNLTFYPMIRLATIEDDTYEPYGYKIPVNVSGIPEYEPYIQPTTTNIYLDEPLRKIGDYADYIDYENQKVYRNIGFKYFKNLNLKKSDAQPVTNAIKIYANDIKENKDYIIDGNKWLCNSLIYTNDKNEYINATKSVINPIHEGINFCFLGYSSNITIEQLRTYIDNDYFIYPLATPTEETVTLPGILLNNGTNIITIGTSVQPSNMWVKYKSK